MTTQNLDDLKKQYEALGKEIAKLEAQPKALVDKDGRYLELPKVGGSVFWLDSEGVLLGSAVHTYDDCSGVVNQGNIFVTREDAEKEAKRRKVMQKLRVLAGGFVPDWGDEGQRKFSVYYDTYQKRWRYLVSETIMRPETVYFPSWKAVQNAIDTLGDDLDVLL